MPILNWLGRDDALKTATNTPYRLLEEVPELGYGDKTKENMIIQGDNLEALKALLPFYAGQVKCIYIDIKTPRLIQFNYSSADFAA